MPAIILSERTSRLHDALSIVLGSLAIAALAQIAVPLPFTPIPVSGQTLAVLLTAAVLGSRRGVLAIALYLAEGCAGFPVFQNAHFGLPYFMGPTGGYLVGFLPAAYLMGLLAERGWDKKLVPAFGAFLLAEAVIFALGAAWLTQFVGLKNVMIAGVLPFLPGEIIKAGLAAAALSGAWKAKA